MGQPVNPRTLRQRVRSGLFGFLLFCCFSPTIAQVKSDAPWQAYIDQLESDSSLTTLSSVLRESEILYERELSEANGSRTRIAQAGLSLYRVRKAAFKILNHNARNPSPFDKNHASTI